MQSRTSSLDDSVRRLGVGRGGGEGGEGGHPPLPVVRLLLDVNEDATLPLGEGLKGGLRNDWGGGGGGSARSKRQGAFLGWIVVLWRAVR